MKDHFEIEVRPNEIRSEEVQEIISRVPSGIIRWGSAMLFGVLLALLTTSWFIQYPDLLRAKVTITTSTPPFILVSRANGNLVLLKEDNQHVSPGDIIAYLRNNASTEEVLYLEKELVNADNKFSVVPIARSLGDLEQDYSGLVNASLEFRLFEETGYYDKQIEQLQKQEVSYRKLQTALAKQKRFAKAELALANEKFKIDSLLFIQKVNTSVDFNRDKSTWLQHQRAFSNAETALVNNEIQLNELSKQISDLEIQKKETRQKLNLEVDNTRKALLARIAKWKETYLFIAPAEGKVASFGFKENEMYIEGGKPVFSVLPVHDTLIARAELPLYNSGKVKPGQRVTIKLENYPFEQYGTVTGVITSISSVASEDKYFINIALPDKLMTSQHKTLEFKQQLSGTTEIITEELRLLERFFYQFRKLIQAR